MHYDETKQRFQWRSEAGMQDHYKHPSHPSRCGNHEHYGETKQRFQWRSEAGMQDHYKHDHVTTDIDSQAPPHYENTPIQIYRKFHLQKLKLFR